MWMRIFAYSNKTLSQAAFFKTPPPTKKHTKRKQHIKQNLV